MQDWEKSNQEVYDEIMHSRTKGSKNKNHKYISKDSKGNYVYESSGAPMLQKMYADYKNNARKNAQKATGISVAENPNSKYNGKPYSTKRKIKEAISSARNSLRATGIKGSTNSKDHTGAPATTFMQAMDNLSSGYRQKTQQRVQRNLNKQKHNKSSKAKAQKATGIKGSTNSKDHTGAPATTFMQAMDNLSSGYRQKTQQRVQRNLNKQKHNKSSKAKKVINILKKAIRKR